MIMESKEKKIQLDKIVDTGGACPAPYCWECVLYKLDKTIECQDLPMKELVKIAKTHLKDM